MAQAATIGVPFITTWASVVNGAHIQVDETILIVGAAGGVGQAATQRWGSARQFQPRRFHHISPGCWGVGSYRLKPRQVAQIEDEHQPRNRSHGHPVSTTLRTAVVARGRLSRFCVIRRSASMPTPWLTGESRCRLIHKSSTARERSPSENQSFASRRAAPDRSKCA
jgi:hypothetical protein